MGKHKDEGCPAAALMEECAEVAQVIGKFFRFDQNWNAIAPGKTKTRWELLQEEMEDVLYQYERLKKVVNN